MTDVNPATRSRWRGRTRALALLAAGTVAGGVLAGTLGASAATSSNGQPSAQRPAGDPAGWATGQLTMPPRGDRDGHRSVGGASPVRTDEKPLSASDAATVRAAALKAVPGGAVYRVETDAGDGVYEAHMTKADGTPVTVKLDKNFAVTKVENGMGSGDPALAGRPHASRRG